MKTKLLCRISELLISIAARLDRIAIGRDLWDRYDSVIETGDPKEACDFADAAIKRITAMPKGCSASATIGRMTDTVGRRCFVAACN